ncbi:MAG: DUF1329 domain-containing protein [Pseudomonadales bacterium]|nr:DUF1329 domain-containing protein [Pseudomonadales bacterium]
MKLNMLVASALLSCGLIATMAHAKVDASQAEKLGGAEFTPMGAEVKANADGSIPAWSGSMKAAPSGMKYSGSGDIYPDPYAAEKLVLRITSANFSKYADKLSDGQKALFNKFPDTFVMNVYPTHRDGKFNDLVEARTKWNATKTEFVNGVDGLKNYTGGAPFPFPQNGAEVIWNARTIHPQPTIVGVLDDMAVYLNGNTQMRRQKYVLEFPYSYKENPVGKVDAEIGINAGLIHVTVEQPKRQKGQMTIVHEALDQVEHERKAWVYIPGSRRVRRAPTVGYDTPDGPGGLVTVDDSLGFNGAMDRYEWKLIGKKEIYIPYHNYKFDDAKTSYDKLLPKGHANPDFMRYELHRTWVVEATLKKGARHVYAKRRFYVDEDSWQIALLESFDGRDDLWRVGILNTLYAYDVQGYVARTQMFHDLQSGAYIALRLVNETAPSDFTAAPKGEKYFSPSSLRKMGTR